MHIIYNTNDQHINNVNENVANKQGSVTFTSYDSGVIFKSKIFTMEQRPRGPMDKASDFESEDCGFDPHRGQFC